MPVTTKTTKKPKTVKSNLQKLSKTGVLYKEAMRIKKQLEKSNTRWKVVEQAGVFHVLGGGYSIVQGATREIALDNALVLQAQANLSEIAWKRDLKDI